MCMQIRQAWKLGHAHLTMQLWHRVNVRPQTSQAAFHSRQNPWAGTSKRIIVRLVTLRLSDCVKSKDNRRACHARLFSLDYINCLVITCSAS